MEAMPIVHIHIADIHFGAIDPEKQFRILEEQFLKPISTIGFQILSIDGDLFDRKFIASSKAVEYATMFVHRCAGLCIMRNASLIIISGTESHEAGQLSLYRDLTNVYSCPIYIVEQAQFIYTCGLKILCLPEEYGKGEDYYAPMLNQVYDAVFMHGTLVGGVYGANTADLNARRPVFGIEHFKGCKGPIIAGHVHQYMCLNNYMYYVSNPIRYKYGEEEAKGYGIVTQLYTGEHYYQFMPIVSDRYDTVELNVDPEEAIENIVEQIAFLQQSSEGNVKVRISGASQLNTQLLTQYFRNSPNIKLEFQKKNQDGEPLINTTEEIAKKYSGMDYLLDPNTDCYSKLAQYINEQEGYKFISSEELRSIYSEK